MNTPIVIRQAALAALFALLWAAPGIAGRDQELGVVDYYATYREKNDVRQKRFDQTVKGFGARLREAGFVFEWISPTIWLENQKARRDRFKRLVIPPTAYAFTEEMYAGMEDFVKAGGLLVACDPMAYLDKDCRYEKEGSGVAFIDRGSLRVLGVSAKKSIRITRVKALRPSPVARGLPPDTWLPLESSGWQVAVRSAYVLMVSDQFDYDKTTKSYSIDAQRETALICFKHYGQGAAIFVNSSLAATNGPMPAIMSNVLSAATREWLCLDEETTNGTTPNAPAGY